MSAAKHEAYGHCRVCHLGVHRYPFGWAHVNGCPSVPAHDVDLVVDCCDEHRNRYAWPSFWPMPYSSVAFTAFEATS